MQKLDYQAKLPVTFLREGNQFVAYTPVLDLSTAGDTFEQAKSRFAEAAHLFFEECHNMGTLERVLKELGWQKENNSWNPPIVVSQETEIVNIPVAV